MEVIFQNILLFKYLFSAISKFINEIYFEIGQDGLRLRSIDPHDFCYVDLLMFKNFFKSYHVSKSEFFSIPITKFGTFLPKITDAKQITLKTDEGYLEINASNNWNMAFRIQFNEIDKYNLSEPKDIRYDASFTLTAKEFSKLIESSSTVSNELHFNITDGVFSINSNNGSFSFVGKPSQILDFNIIDNKAIDAYIISSYLNNLNQLISRCDCVKINIGNNVPTKLDIIYKDKAIFSFSLSNKKGKSLLLNKKSRMGESLPRLTISKLPDILLYLSNTPSGENNRTLVAMGLETTGGDYSRMAIKLNFVKRERGNLIITDEGKKFVNVLNSDLKLSKQFLHNIAIKEIKPYNKMIKLLRKNALTPDEIFEKLNNESASIEENRIDRQDLNTLLGLAMWCNVIDKKLALYYYEN